MNLRPTYRLFFGLLLSSVFVASIVTQGVHVLLDHHEAESICEASGNSTHIHGEEYAHHPCHICIYKVAQFQETLEETSTIQPSLEEGIKPEQEQLYLSPISQMLRHQRAPPFRS